MDEGPGGDSGSTSRAGGSALVLGVLSVLCALIPVIGDLVAVPAALLAVVVGAVGVVRYDAGRAPRLLPSLVGALLGAVSLLLTVSSLIATSPLG